MVRSNDWDFLATFPPGFLPLIYAVHLIGKHYFGPAWTGDEVTAGRQLPIEDSTSLERAAADRFCVASEKLQRLLAHRDITGYVIDRLMGRKRAIRWFYWQDSADFDRLVYL